MVKRNLVAVLAMGFCLGLPMAFAQQPAAPDSNTPAGQLFTLTNQARAAAGVKELAWDPALAAAALAHSQRMATEAQLSHDYPGEPEMTARASQAGAHFSLLEENVAMGASPATIQQEWMDSSGHRANLLNRDIDRVGIAVTESHGQLFAVTDFSRGVAVMTAEQIEAKIADLLRTKGLAVDAGDQSSVSQAREYCVSEADEEDAKPKTSAQSPAFRMLWQSSDLNQLPPQLVERMAARPYRRAAVGSCPAQGANGSFSGYRLAVLLYSN